MWVLFEGFISALMTFGAGIGVGHLVDTLVPDKLPAGTAPLGNFSSGGKINWLKLGLIVFLGAIGIMITKFIGKKLNIKLLKK